jgi:hypothetical protein
VSGGWAVESDLSKLPAHVGRALGGSWGEARGGGELFGMSGGRLLFYRIGSKICWRWCRWLCFPTRPIPNLLAAFGATIGLVAQVIAAVGAGEGDVARRVEEVKQLPAPFERPENHRQHQDDDREQGQANECQEDQRRERRVSPEEAIEPFAEAAVGQKGGHERRAMFHVEQYKPNPHSPSGGSKAHRIGQGWRNG